MATKLYTFEPDWQTLIEDGDDEFGYHAPRQAIKKMFAPKPAPKTEVVDVVVPDDWETLDYQDSLQAKVNEILAGRLSGKGWSFSAGDIIKLADGRTVVFTKFDWERGRVEFENETGDARGATAVSNVIEVIGHVVGFDGETGLEQIDDDFTDANEPTPMIDNYVGRKVVCTQGSWAGYTVEVVSQSGAKVQIRVYSGPVKEIGKTYGMRLSTLETQIRWAPKTAKK